MQRAARQLALFSENDESGPESGFSVRESGRARRLSIKVYPRGKVEVVVPKRTRAAEVQQFVTEHRQWIAETRAAFAKLYPPQPSGLPQAIDMPAIRRRILVKYEEEFDATSVRYRQRGDELCLTGRVDDRRCCVDALKRWLGTVARGEFEPRLRALSALTGNSFRRMQIRGQKTCWGSHSARGTISINYCLLFLAPDLVRYLMVHELCHARHMNHSRRFWAQVQRFEPDYERIDRALGEAWQDIPTWLGFH